jgi:hypothetical protein
MRPHKWLETYDRTPLFLLATGIAWWFVMIEFFGFAWGVRSSSPFILITSVHFILTGLYTWLGWKFYNRYIGSSAEKRAGFPLKEIHYSALMPISMLYYFSSGALILAWIPIMIGAVFAAGQYDNYTLAVTCVTWAAAFSPIYKFFWPGDDGKKRVTIIIEERT